MPLPLRAAALAASSVTLLFALGACAPLGAPRTQLAFHLREAEAAIDEGRAPVTLRYAVHNGDGDWTYDVVLGPGAFAERRTHGDDVYALGLDADRPWLSVRDRPPVAVSGVWAEEARMEAVILGMRFLDPGRSDHIEPGHAGRGRWGLSLVPRGGRSLDVELDLRTNLPVLLSYVDTYDRVAACDGIAWRSVGGRSVVTSMRCGTISGDVGRVETSFRLESAEPGEAEWAHPKSVLAEPRMIRPSVTPILDPMRVRVPVASATHESATILLDSGSPWTILTASAARDLGVMRTGAPVKGVRPPWLRDSTLWVGVLDRLQIGADRGAEIHGAPVLVAEDDEALGGEQGLLGTDAFRRFIVDVDTPAGALRFHDPKRFFPPPGADVMPITGTPVGRIMVPGAIPGVDEGPVILDTGAAEDVVVLTWRMSAVRTRHPGDEVRVGAEDRVTTEYASTIDGFYLGPYAFPRMHVLAHDRDKYGNINTTDTLALVGMGMLGHFRLMFDMRHATLYTVPGPTLGAYVKSLQTAGW